MAEPLTADGMTVLLVYGARIKVARDGKPGIRVTAGYPSGAVLLEAIGFPTGGEATVAISQAAAACRQAGLVVQQAPQGASRFPARVIRRRP